jgi:uncharacterized coiled-coil protein SlyX
MIEPIPSEQLDDSIRLWRARDNQRVWPGRDVRRLLESWAQERAKAASLEAVLAERNRTIESLSGSLDAFRHDRSKLEADKALLVEALTQIRESFDSGEHPTSMDGTPCKGCAAISTADEALSKVAP